MASLTETKNQGGRAMASRANGGSTRSQGPVSFVISSSCTMRRWSNSCAGRISAGLPRHVDEADLASYGIIGLIDAIERFDPGLNVKFETYAIPRIRGAIIDELRSIDWVPRSVRTKARAVEQSYASLQATLHRTPTMTRSPPTWR